MLKTLGYNCIHYFAPLILKRPKSVFMKIEIFAFFESVNQILSFNVNNVKFLSQEPLKKLPGTLSLNDI